MQKYLRLMVTVVTSMLFCAAMVSAQVTGGAVTGSVTDANGAVIPDAKVVLKDKLRGQEITAVTSGSGSFQFPNVAVGDYSITITGPGTGFASQSREVNVSL